MKTLLFLCTGNYFRSRFAEALFNRRAEEAGLDWRAESRGLAPGLAAGNIGPVSRFTEDGLRARGIAPETPPRQPRPLTEEELQAADLVIGLKEAEHRPALETRFRARPGVEFWQIHDIDVAEPEESLALIEQEVHKLIARLSPGRKGEVAPGD